MNNTPLPLARAVVVAAVGMISISAQAATDESAFRQHFAAAVDAYESGRNARKFGDAEQATARFRQAVEEYRLAYEASPQSKALFGTAQAYRALGEMERALRLYEEYLREDPNGAYASAARTLVPGLREQVERKAATTVAPPAGAPTSPEQPAHTPPQPAATAARVSQSAPTPTSTVIVSAPTQQPRKVPVYERWWLWTSVGVVAVAVGVGLGVGLSQNSTTYPTANTRLGTFQWSR